MLFLSAKHVPISTTGLHVGIYDGLMGKRRLLMIATQSLFGIGIISLLKKQKDRLVIKKVPDVKTALRIGSRFQPDVIVYFRETSLPGDETLLQELISHYHTRVIHCTLEADLLTIYDKKRIKNATAEDLLSAVMTGTAVHPSKGL